MSLNSVMKVLQVALDTYSSPAMLTAGMSPIKCYIAPPQIETSAVEGPIVFIWGGRAATHRTTAPHNTKHTGGFKRSPWEVDIWPFFVDSAAPSDTAYPLVLDAIRRAIEDIPYPQTLTDQDSEPQQTQLIAVGERLDLEFPPPTSIEDSANLLYTSRLTCQMIEDYQS